jgi:branched-chain amino acid transport system permease protein
MIQRAAAAAAGRRELGVLVAMLVAVAAFPNRPPGGVVALAVLGGAAVALQAIGLLLVYQTDGILNFAQVQIGAVGATFFVLFARYTPVLELIRSACPVCIDRVTPTMARWNYLVAAILGLVVSMLVGWLLSVVLVRRFASAPRLVVTVATIFVVPVLGLLQRTMANTMTTVEQRELTAGAASLAAPNAPLSFSLRWDPAVFGLPHFVLAVMLVGAVVLVWAFLRRSTSGASLRAVADNPDRAATLGLDVPRVKSRAWLIAAGLSGAAGIAGAMAVGAPPLDSLGIEPMVLILAVGLVARMASYATAVATALTMSVFAGALDWSFNAASIFGAVLLVTVAAVLALQRRSATRAQRERDAGWSFGREVRPTPTELRSHPTVRRWARRGGIIVTVILLAYPWIMSPSELSLGTGAVIFGFVALSLLVLTGWAGQLSLGQMAFAAIGAYIAAVSRLPFPAALVVAAAAGALAAFLIGLPALRLRGMQLAVATLAMALATSAILLDGQRLGRFLPETIRRPRLAGLDDDRAFYYLVLALVAAGTAAVIALRRSRFARALIAARDNEQAAESFGISLVRARLGAFAVSGFLAALAGALMAFHQYGVHPAAFAPEQSVRAFLWTVIGGLGAVAGPLMGAAVRGAVDIASNNQVVQLVAAGAGGLLLLIVAPGGLVRIAFGIRDAMLRRLAVRQHIIVPSLLADTSGVRERAPIAARDEPAPVPVYAVDDQWALATKPKESVHG